MKRCPTCNQVFEDEWLTFCTIDGSPLIDTGALYQPPTVVVPRPLETQTDTSPQPSVYSIGATTHQNWCDPGTKAGFLIVTGVGVEFQRTKAPQFVNIDSMDRLQRLEEMEGDLRLLSIALVRAAADNGRRYDNHGQGGDG